MSQLVYKYFSTLTSQQKLQIEMLESVYREWNEKINVISRKDIDSLYERHVLHSLVIAKVIRFKENTSILDVGTGGGFPGIPLAILFPECSLLLTDSIGKKINVVNEVIKELNLKNVKAIKSRAEEVERTFDFVVSRAVTSLNEMTSWVGNKINTAGFNEIPNGILYLKGGDLTEELKELDIKFNKKFKTNIFDLKEFFSEEFFVTKKLIHIFK